jgi:hypothetical protein
VHDITCVSEKRMDGGGVGCESEDRESGVGSGVNTTILLVTLQVVGISVTVIRL